MIKNVRINDYKVCKNELFLADLTVKNGFRSGKLL